MNNKATLHVIKTFKFEKRAKSRNLRGCLDDNSNSY